MSENIPISLHNSDLFLKPEFTETNQEELNQDTFKNPILKKGPSLGENNHIKPLYTSDLLPRLQGSAYFSKAITLYTDSPISIESETKKRGLKSVNQRSKSKIDKLENKTAKRRGQSPLKYELHSGFILYDKAQLESQNKYYLRSKSRFAENAVRFISKQTSTSQNEKKSEAFLSLRSSKHTFAPLSMKVVNPVQTENKALTKRFQKLALLTSFVNQLSYSVCNKRVLNYQSKPLLKGLPSLIRSGISREFLLVTINLVLLSVLAIVQRNNYGKGFFPIISKGPHTVLYASKIPNISSSYKVAQDLKQSSWQYLNLIKPGYLSFVLQRKVFTVPWQDQRQERFIGIFSGELNLNSNVANDVVRSSKYKHMGLINDKESLFLCLPKFVALLPTKNVYDTVSSFTPKSLNKDSVYPKSIAERSLSFCTEKKKPLLSFDRENYVYCKWESFAQVTKVLFKPLVCNSNSHLTRTEFWSTNDRSKALVEQVLPPARFVDCVIKPWYCIKAHNTSNNDIVATRYVQEKVDNAISYKNPKIQGFQYYMPYYTSQERIFAESDTIPSKRGTICCKTVKNLNKLSKQSKTKTSFLLGHSDQFCLKEADNQKFVTVETPQDFGFAQTKPKSSELNSGYSSIITSQFILKRCFYRYGFFVILPSKKVNLFQLSKEERNYFTKSPYINNIKQLGITETKNHTINQIHDQGEALSERSSLPVTGTGDAKTSFLQPVTKSEFLYPYSGVQTEFPSRTTPQKNQTNVKSNCIPGDYINFALYKNVDTSSFEPSVNQRVVPILSKPNFVIEQSFSQTPLKRDFVFVKGGLSTVKIGKYSPVFTKSHNFSKLHSESNNRLTKKVVFPPIFVWSKYDLSRTKANAFAQVKSSILTFNFIPDSLVQNTSVSGYKFPELKKKEIVYLFRQRAIFYFYLYLTKSNKNKVFEKPYKETLQTLLSQIKTPFHTFQSYELIDQILSAQGQESGYLNKALTRTLFLLQQSNNKTKSNLVVNKASENFGMSSNSSEENVGFLLREPDFSMIDFKMQYTQINLDEIGNVKDVFSQMGRDYEEYLRKPKDSLPALIISPSLEDDREIEEEGIQIFRKRDLIKNTKNAINTGSEVGEGKTFTEHSFNERYNDKNLNNTSFSTTQEFNKSEKTESKSEIQNRQILVKNALRQAQEEIDNIAKKEEKGSDKDKQVIPPLTRLEALYTVRNREKKREQAKDLTSNKSTTSYLRLPAKRNLFNILIPRFGLGQKKAKFADLVSQNKSTLPESTSITNRLHLQELQKNKKTTFSSKTFKGSLLPVVKKKSLPFFEELFLCSDKPHNAGLKSTPKLGLRDSCILTPWLFSKLGDSSVCTDRKQSFFGEMSLLPKKLTAQEQKQIFQQKANPLLKVNTKNRQSILNTSLFSSKIPNSDQQKTVNFDSIQSPRFQIGTRLLPESMSGLQGKALFQSLPSPTYFYKNLSQNKACQASAPKIKGTPLGSPVSHRVWQPKRMEPSTFRVSPRSQSTSVVPRISQKDWKNMIKWQLKKHFFEEDKRLLSLSLNKNKKPKIKKVNLYLPWISIKKAEDLVNNQLLTEALTEPQQNKAISGNEWPLTRLDLRTNNLNLTDLKGFLQKSSFAPRVNTLVHSKGNEVNDLLRALRLPETNAVNTFFTGMEKDSGYRNNFKTPDFLNLLTDDSLIATANHLHRQSTELHGKASNYWRLPIQQTFSTTTWPIKKQQSLYLSQNERLGTVNKSRVKIPEKELGIGKKSCNESILFESVTTYSWLFVYTFVFVLMFKQLFNFVYKVGFKDFFIKFLNSDFGRTVTSEEFRYSIQNLPLTEFYMPKKRLQELLGLERNKAQLLEIVWFLRNNCQGRNGPRGVLLVGPPGVENVSVVQAIAGEAKVPIIVQSLEKIAQDNEPQRQLEQLYMRAQKQAPCVLFLDQLDTIGARRDQLFTNKRHAHNLGPSITSIPDQEDYNVNTEVQKSVNSGNKLNVVLRLLTILDGITQSNGVITVATAQNITKLDPALLRPKRFDRRIYLSLPNQQDRVHLFKIQTQSIGNVKEMPWDYLSLQTENMSTADIKSAINYSLFRAVLKNSVHTVETLEYGIDCVKTLTNKRIEKK